MNSAQEHFNPSRMKIKVKPILKSKITPALKPSKQLAYTYQISPKPAQDLHTVLQEIQINRQLVKQITELDQQIEQMQLNIAGLQQDYQFAETQDFSVCLQDLSVAQENYQQSDQQRLELPNRLLPHLKNVLFNSRSISIRQILGSDVKDRRKWQNRKKFQRTYPCSPSPNKVLLQDRS